MPDWTNPIEIKKDFFVAVSFIWLSVGISLYDHVLYAPWDWSIITGSRKRRWPQIFYFSTKLSWWAYVVTLYLFCYTSTKIDCQATIEAAEFFMGTIVFSCSVLLACRAVCIWQGRARTIVSAVLGVFGLGVLASWMVGVPDIKAIWIPDGGDVWTDGACVFAEVPMRYSVKYIITIAYDFLVLALTVGGIMRMSTSSRIGDLLVSQGAFYFLITFIVNAIVCGLTLARLNPVMALVGAVPSSCVAMLASTRLYYNLAEDGRPQKAIDSGAYAGRRASGFISGSRNRFSRFAVQNLGKSAEKSMEEGTGNGKHGIYGVQALPYQGGTSSAGSDSIVRSDTTSMRKTPDSASDITRGDGDAALFQHKSTTSSSSDSNSKAARLLGATQGIAVEELRTVEIAPLPAHLAGPHFLNDEQLAQVTGERRENAADSLFAGLMSRRSADGKANGRRPTSPRKPAPEA